MIQWLLKYSDYCIHWPEISVLFCITDSIVILMMTEVMYSFDDVVVVLMMCCWWVLKQAGKLPAWLKLARCLAACDRIHYYIPFTFCSWSLTYIDGDFGVYTLISGGWWWCTFFCHLEECLLFYFLVPTPVDASDGATVCSISSTSFLSTMPFPFTLLYHCATF